MNKKQVYIILIGIALILVLRQLNILRVNNYLEQNVYSKEKLIHTKYDSDSIFGEPNYTLTYEDINIDTTMERSVYIYQYPVLPFFKKAVSFLDIYVTYDKQSMLVTDFHVSID